MRPITEIVTSAQEQWLDAVKSIQEPIVEGVRSWSSTVDDLLPSGVTIPFADRLPQPVEWARTSFDLAERALQAQRDLVVNLLEAAVPQETAEKTEKKASRASN